MTNDTERNFEQQPKPKTTDTADQPKKSPSPEGGQRTPTQQDPSKKNPSQVDEPRPREGEGSEQPEKRRA
jgi:hypothetical protein